MIRLILLGLFWGALTFGASTPAAAAEQPSTQEIATGLGFDEKDKSRVLSGEVVAADLPETTDSMLSQAIAAIVPQPPSKIATRIIEGQQYRMGNDMLGFGVIDLQDIEGSLGKATFTRNESDELDKLGDAEPGSEFNLSTEEFLAIQAAVDAGKASPEQLSALYRGFLVERVKAYKAGGVSAIAPYDRGGNQVSPSDDLKAAADAVKVLPKISADFYQAFLNYPNNNMEGVEHSYLWVKQVVEDRPTVILEHRMVYQDAEKVIGFGRQFFVGQSYDSAQFGGGAYPVDNGSLVFYTSRTMTDQVAGFMQATRHSVGRGMMRDELIEFFKELQKTE